MKDFYKYEEIGELVDTIKKYKNILKCLNSPCERGNYKDHIERLIHDMNHEDFSVFMETFKHYLEKQVEAEEVKLSKYSVK